MRVRYFQLVFLAVFLSLLATSATWGRCVELVERIGQGDFGSVWLVRNIDRHRDDQRAFSIIKALSDKLAPEIREQIFKRYAWIVSLRSQLTPDSDCLIACSPPQELEIRALDENGFEHFYDLRVIEMEAAAGSAASIEKWNPIQMEKLISDITRALFDLRQLGLVHHDPNPRNILYFVDESGSMRFKLGDLDNVTERGRPAPPAAWEFNLAPWEYDFFRWAHPSSAIPKDFPNTVDDFFQLGASVFYLTFGFYPIDLMASGEGLPVLSRRRLLFDNPVERDRWHWRIQEFLNESLVSFQHESLEHELAFKEVIKFLKASLIVNRSQREWALNSLHAPLR